MKHASVTERRIGRISQESPVRHIGSGEKTTQNISGSSPETDTGDEWQKIQSELEPLIAGRYTVITTQNGGCHSSNHKVEDVRSARFTNRN